MGAASQTNLSGRLMTSYEVAEQLAGFGRGEGRSAILNPKTKRYRYEIHPDVRRWRQRIREACQACAIEHHKDDAKAPNATIYFRWREVEAWADDRWPKQRRIRV